MTTPDIEKIKAALPSKKFALVIGSCVVLVLVILVVSSKFGSSGSFSSKQGSLTAGRGTVGDLVTQDSNSNGIADWEESLWGLDPKGDGAANKATINQKKAANGIAVDEGDDSAATTQTDQFSQNLLATIVALQQSGTLTPEAVTNLASSIGDSVDAKHAAVTTYTMADMHITQGENAKAAYKTALKALVDQYSDTDIGTEMTIILAGFGGGGSTELKKLHPLPAVYAELSKKLVALQTPREVAQDALNLANAEAAMGASLPQIENLYTDVISGMVGLDDFTKANDASDLASKNIRLYFSY